MSYSPHLKQLHLAPAPFFGQLAFSLFPKAFIPLRWHRRWCRLPREKGHLESKAANKTRWNRAYFKHWIFFGGGDLSLQTWCWVALQPLMMPRAKGEWQCWFWIRTCILNKSHWHHDVLHQMYMNEPERSSQGIDGNRLSNSANCFLESMCLMFVHNMLWNVHMQFITTPLATIPKSDIRSEPLAITSSSLASPKVPYETVIGVSNYVPNERSSNTFRMKPTQDHPNLDRLSDDLCGSRTLWKVKDKKELEASIARKRGICEHDGSIQHNLCQRIKDLEKQWKAGLKKCRFYRSKCGWGSILTPAWWLNSISYTLVHCMLHAAVTWTRVLSPLGRTTISTRKVQWQGGIPMSTGYTIHWILIATCLCDELS